MDLKRAWRNGFLAPLLLAVPVYDLALGEHPYRIADGSTQHHSSPKSKEAIIGTDITGSIDAADDDRLIIPEPVLNSLLFGSGDPAIDDSREPALQLDPQDIFDSADGAGDGYPELTDDVQLFADARSGSGSPLSIAFAGPRAAIGTPFSPFSLSLFTAGGNSGSGGASGNSADPTAGGLSGDSSSEEQTPSDENGSPQSVPEPSSLVLLAIGATAMALLIQRRSKRLTV